MKKFLVVSGFLGAGKTTFMIGLSKELAKREVKCAVIANDLGARDLIDTRYTRQNGCDVSELSGECICYQTENLVDRLRRLFDYEHCELVASDIPGCGVGALDHVYLKLDAEYHGEFELAPFTVIVDADRLRAIMPRKAQVNLPQEMNYLFRAQLQEADVVLLNKQDRLGEAEREECLSFLRDFCPQAAVFSISAKTGAGMQTATEYLLTHSARLQAVDIGYGGEEFMAAESTLCWYNRQYYARVCCDTFDPDAYLLDLAQAIRKRLCEKQRNVPHLKLYAETEEGAAKLSMVGVDNEIETDLKLGTPLVDLPVIINARAACEPAVFSQIIDEAMEETGRDYQLDIVVFFTECFGITDEGRI